jgi:hypothetical protein
LMISCSKNVSTTTAYAHVGLVILVLLSLPPHSIINDIEEFENDNRNDNHDDRIKEFDYDDAIEDNQLSLPSVGQQKTFSCKKSVTTYPKKCYCNIIV